MTESIDRYFLRMPVGRRTRPTAERLWCPHADVLEIPDGWLVKIELAGVSPDEVEITVDDHTLHVTGVRRDATYTEGISYYQMEITYSRFSKKLNFPSAIAGASVERIYRDGLLVLRLQKRGEAHLKGKVAAA